jgi:hypothetical protein
MSKWVIWAAWISGLLTICGAVLIVHSIMTSPQIEIAAADSTSPTVAKSFASKPVLAKEADAINNTTEPDITGTSDTLHTGKQTTSGPIEVDANVAVKQEPVEDAAAAEPKQLSENKSNEKEKRDKEKKKRSFKEEEKFVNRLLTRKELYQLLIRANRAKAAKQTNCIHVRTSTRANNSKAAMQVAAFLRSHKFVMAGRSAVPLKMKGVKVVASGSCITIHVGELY